MTGAVQSLYRYPIKGFTPEKVARARLEPCAFFPDDRLYAVENGPSGFDPMAPAFVSKHRFTVLAQIPALARITTRYDAGVVEARAPDHPPLRADLTRDEGRAAFAGWLEGVIAPDDRNGPLSVVFAPGWRFTDHPEGHISILNLETVRALGRAMGTQLDPLRFRANVQVEGWPAWCEADWAKGRRIRIGAATLELFKPIQRCVATHVDLRTGVRDADVLAALHTQRGDFFCGLYAKVIQGGEIVPRDVAEALP